MLNFCIPEEVAHSRSAPCPFPFPAASRGPAAPHDAKATSVTVIFNWFLDVGVDAAGNPSSSPLTRGVTRGRRPE